MLMKFIGEDYLIGLKKGRIYKCSIDECSIDEIGDYIWLTYYESGLNNPSIPYFSYKELYENWEKVGE